MEKQERIRSGGDWHLLGSRKSQCTAWEEPWREGRCSRLEFLEEKAAMSWAQRGLCLM